MTEQRSSSLLLPIIIIVGTLLFGLLVIVPVISILAGAGPFGDESEQTPFVTDDRAFTVTIRDFDYSPRDLTVDVGTEVTWVNEDSATHDATDRSEAWTTEHLREGDSEKVAFDEPGAFEYYCTIHPSMRATLTVR